MFKPAVNFLGGEKIWRVLTNFWTFIFIAFIFLNIIFEERFSFLVTIFSILYVGTLAIYAGTKEFDRWYATHRGQHPGELFVAIWTFIMLLIFVISIIFNKDYQMYKEIVTVYIAVLSIFAITQKSKRLYREKIMEKKKSNTGE